jgi:hypothetical protein
MDCVMLLMFHMFLELYNIRYLLHKGMYSGQYLTLTVTNSHSDIIFIGISCADEYIGVLGVNTNIP